MGKMRNWFHADGEAGPGLLTAGRTGVRLATLGAALVLALGALPAARAQGPLPDLSHPLGLDEIVRLALQRNLDLAQAGQGVDAAHGALTASYSGLLPSATLGYGYSRSAENSSQGQVYFDQSQNRVVQTSGGVTTWGYSYSTSLSGSTNLINLPAWYTYRQARTGLAAARSGWNDTRDGIVLAVRQQYFSVIGAMELAKVDSEAYNLAQDQLKRSQSLFQLGSVAKSDVLQAEVNLASAERDQISAQNSIEQERAKLAVQMALPMDAPLRVAGPAPLPDSLAAPVESEAIAAAQKNRPDLLQAKQNLESARLAEMTSKTRFLPSLGASYSYSKHRPGAGEVLNAFANDYQANVAVGLSMTLFDGMNMEGRLQQARAQRRSDEEALAAKNLQVSLEVREAMLSIKNASQEIRSARQGVSFAEESVRLQKALYESGGGTLLEWNNAQVQLTRARQALVQGEIDFRLAQAALSKAVGASVE